MGQRFIGMSVILGIFFQQFPEFPQRPRALVNGDEVVEPVAWEIGGHRATVVQEVPVDFVVVPALRCFIGWVTESTDLALARSRAGDSGSLDRR